MSVVLTGVVRNGRIEVAGPVDLPDGTPVTITEVAAGEYVGGSGDGPMTPDEIARVLAAMAKLRPLELTPEEEADLTAWEKKVEGHGIANADKGIEDVFR